MGYNAQMSQTTEYRAANAKLREKIYFVLCCSSCRIKIGISSDPRKRRDEMQTGSGGLLKLLGWTTGTVDDERAYHTRFASSRHHGEWFTASPDLLEHMRHDLGIALPHWLKANTQSPKQRRRAHSVWNKAKRRTQGAF